VSAIAFDLLHLVGADLRREPLEDRKETLANLLADASDCIQHSDVFTESAKLLEVAFEYGLEGIFSKRLGSLLVRRASAG
jgi:bifunctional non-homologous end joining protein LigD